MGKCGKLSKKKLDYYKKRLAKFAPLASSLGNFATMPGFFFSVYNPTKCYKFSLQDLWPPHFIRLAHVL